LDGDFSLALMEGMEMVTVTMVIAMSRCSVVFIVYPLCLKMTVTWSETGLCK
jgi:hypothetical protein